MRVIISIVVTLAISAGLYIVFLRSATSGSGSPKTVISTTTVQIQLVNIAEAERIYYVQNSTYGSLDELASSGTFKLKVPDPDGYEYLVDASASGFKATAHHADTHDAKAENYPVLSIDQTMQVERSGSTQSAK